MFSCAEVRGDDLGRGSLGNVVQALDQGSGQLFAVKEVGVRA